MPEVSRPASSFPCGECLIFNQKLDSGPGKAAIDLLIFEKGLISPSFHVAATVMLWGALALTVISAVDYFYRFFRKADYRAIVPEEQRWS